MGAAVGQCLAAAGHRVLWVPEGRSPASAARAEAAGLTGVDLAELVRSAEVIMSVCPPHVALDTAREVARAGFGGLYMDANAISPATAREVAAIVADGGAGCVDGGIIGTPPVRPGFIRLYLSGPRADEVYQLFEDTPVDTRLVDHASQGAGRAGGADSAG
ncbi:MAG TPA: NAD(P)-binding domain-containing protein, partial [Streptosporangiaceae bacterium]|nr:NAD(P)-binding domain-containing protein [Streptosporangiaceae bacterium]